MCGTNKLAMLSYLLKLHYLIQLSKLRMMKSKIEFQRTTKLPLLSYLWKFCFLIQFSNLCAHGSLKKEKKILQRV